MPFRDDQLKDLLPAIFIAGAAVSALLCFAGYAIWRFLLGIAGLLVGFVVGAAIVAGIAAANSQAEPPVGQMIGFGLLGAAIGAALFAGIRPLGTFLVVGCWVAVIIAGVAKIGGATDEAAGGAGFVVGLILGIIAAATGRGGIIVCSSLAGGVGLADNLRNFINLRGIEIGSLTSEQVTGLFLLGGLVLSVIGMVMQFVLFKKKPAAPPPAPVPQFVPAGAAPAPAQHFAPPPSPRGTEEQLRELMELRAKALITESEYDFKRRELLARM